MQKNTKNNWVNHNALIWINHLFFFPTLLLVSSVILSPTSRKMILLMVARIIFLVFQLAFSLLREIYLILLNCVLNPRKFLKHIVISLGVKHSMSSISSLIWSSPLHKLSSFSHVSYTRVILVKDFISINEVSWIRLKYILISELNQYQIPF